MSARWSEQEEDDVTPVDDRIEQHDSEGEIGTETKKYEVFDLNHDDILIGHIVIDVKFKDMAEKINLLLRSKSQTTERRPKMKPIKSTAELFYKTEKCKNEFNGQGRCAYSAKCKFAHTDDELKSHIERKDKVIKYA